MIQSSKDIYEKNGFLVVKNVFDNDEVSEMKREIEVIASSENCKPFLQNEPQLTNSIRKIKNLTDVSPLFLTYSKSPKLISILTGLSDCNLRLHGGIGWLKPAGGCAMHPHQDAVYWTHISPQKFVIAWVALDKATMNNGCIQYLAGSHNAGKINHLGERSFFLELDNLSQYSRASAEVDAGDIVIHDGYAVHWSEENRSASSRIAVSFSYFPITSSITNSAYSEEKFPYIL